MILCLVGYGAIAEKHLEALRRVGGVRPRVLVGRRREPAEEFARRWGFEQCVLDLGEALDDRSVDAVVIASPNALHADQVHRALTAGKHVLVEIPIALKLADAERVTALARKVDRRLMVAHTMRYFPAMQEMRRRVASGAFTVHHLVGFFGLLRRTNVTSAGAPRSWTDDLLWHFGAHMVDIALWITGRREARVTSCQWGPRHPRQGILDLSLALSLPGGELFTLAQSYNVEQFRWRLTFIGEQGTLDFDNGTLFDARGATVIPYRPVVDLTEQDAEFVASVREGRDPAITGEEVLPAMRILDEAERLAATS